MDYYSQLRQKFINDIEEVLQDWDFSKRVFRNEYREFCVDITIQFRNPMLKEKWNEWSNEVTEDIWKVVEQYGAFLYIEDYTFHFSLDFQIE